MNALAGTRYDLFTHDDTRRLVWRFKDEGVVVEDEALLVMRASRWARIPFRDIAAVTLSSNVIGRSPVTGQCIVRLEDGRRVVISSGNEQGIADGRRDGPYRLFLRDFHRKLIESGEARAIEFRSGYTQARMNGLIFATIIGTLFFIATPLVLLLLTRDVKTLLICLAGIGFIWPAWRMIEANRPMNYEPSAPPDLID